MAISHTGFSGLTDVNDALLCRVLPPMPVLPMAQLLLLRLSVSKDDRDDGLDLG